MCYLHVVKLNCGFVSRNCFTGEGRFFFYSPQSRLIHSPCPQSRTEADQRASSLVSCKFTNNYAIINSAHYIYSLRQLCTRRHQLCMFPRLCRQALSRSSWLATIVPLVWIYPCPLCQPRTTTSSTTLHRPPLSTIEPYSRIGNHTPTHTSTTPSYLHEYEKLNHKYRPSPPLMHHFKHYTINEPNTYIIFYIKLCHYTARGRLTNLLKHKIHCVRGK